MSSANRSTPSMSMASPTFQESAESGGSSGIDTSSSALQEISLKLSALQSTLAALSPQPPQPPPVPAHHFYPPQASLPILQQIVPPPPHQPPSPQEDPLLSSPVIISQNSRLNQIQLSIAALKTDVAALKTTVSHVGSSTGVCSGAMALTALLLAISFVAIIVIILASLGLAGVLPQFVLLLEGYANLIWAIVSASIVTMICLISVLCVTLIRHKPTPSLT